MSLNKYIINLLSANLFLFFFYIYFSTLWVKNRVVRSEETFKLCWFQKSFDKMWVERKRGQKIEWNTTNENKYIVKFNIFIITSNHFYLFGSLNFLLDN